jgi:tRNA (guanine-N7-)-methyltransferase
MRLRKRPEIKEKIKTLSGVIPGVIGERLRSWEEIFGKNQPLHLEIGVGKGAFITQLAGLHPEIHYVGIERVADILYAAARKNQENPLPNLRFLEMDGTALPFYFQPGEVQRIYMNFSDPWPKRRHAKRRLTHRHFLEIYRRILAPLGEIHFKTDDRDFFEFSLNQLAAAGYSMSHITRDLHRSCHPGVIMTEYEVRFVQMGRTICRLEAYAPGKRLT